MSSKNILIFPQERAISYIHKIDTIDILIIDEFYKAGVSFDKERAPILLKAILELGKKAKQKYFLQEELPVRKNDLLDAFSDWLKLNYGNTYILSNYMTRITTS